MKFNISIQILLLSLIEGTIRSNKIQPEVVTELSKQVRIPVLVQLTPASIPQLPKNLTKTKMAKHMINLMDTIKVHSRTSILNVETYLKGLLKLNQLSPYRYYSISNTYALEATKAQIDILSKFSQVEEISSNKIVKSQVLSTGVDNAVVNDDVKWDGNSLLWSISYINGTNVDYQTLVNQQNLRYANADTGVDFTHPALNSNYLGKKGDNSYDHNYVWWDANKKLMNSTKPNLACGINSSKPCDDDIHGTHTMGTVVGDFNLGVAPTTKWLACKNMDQGFGSPETYLSCLQFLISPTRLDGTDPRPELRPHVVGNSYGCPASEGCSRSTFKYALQAMKSAGIFMSVSAGNDGNLGCNSVLSPPAIDPNSFVVAATRYRSNLRASFSSVGPVPERYKAIDLAAPGVNITSCIPNNKYASLQGTSMASPHVSGAALVLIAACPYLEWRVDDIANILKLTATKLSPNMRCGDDDFNSIPNNEYGHGLLNLGKAINYCQTYGKDVIQQ